MGDKTPAQAASKIAREHLRIETLEPRGVDRLDFHEVHVVSVKAALEAAFLAGINEAAARLLPDAQAGAGRRPSLKETQAAQARAKAAKGDRFTWKEGDVVLIKPGDE